jgi:hypothetical protein
MGNVIDVEIYPIRQVPVVNFDQKGNICIRLLMEALKITKKEIEKGEVIDGTTHTK